MRQNISTVIKEEIPITKYATSQGLTLVPHGVKGKLKTLEHDSLIISPDVNLFSWNSRSVGGSVIDFAMELHGFNQAEAISHLRGTLDNPEYQQLPTQKPLKPVKNEKASFKLPQKGSAGYKNLFAYLSKSRCIDTEIIQKMLDNNLIFQDERRNICFTGKDYDNQIKFASLRGTNTETIFRGDVPASSKNISFTYNMIEATQPINQIFVTEAPIDIFSIMTMLKQGGRDFENYGYISLAGTHEGALLYHLQNHPEIVRIYLCQDNDSAGNNSRITCRNKLLQQGFKGEIIDKPPRFAKDFNEELTLKTKAASVNRSEIQHPKQEIHSIQMERGI